MNIQAIMKQAQKMQKEMMSEKEAIDKEIFIGTSSLVKVEVYGNKKIKSVKIESGNLDNDDLEMLEDMIVIAINDAINKIDVETEKRMGRYTANMPGIF